MLFCATTVRRSRPSLCSKTIFLLTTGLGVYRKTMNLTGQLSVLGVQGLDNKIIGGSIVDPKTVAKMHQLHTDR